MIKITDFDATVYAEEELPEVSSGKPNEISARIASHVSELVENGATIQTGIGTIPDAVLASLANHKELGVHTEMLSDGIIPLIETGVITNQHKKKHRGKTVTSFLVGSRKLYDFVDDNPAIVALGIDYVNDTAVIRTNPKVTAINSAIEVDITGQICSDSIGAYHYSGSGVKWTLFAVHLCQNTENLLLLYPLSPRRVYHGLYLS